MQMPRWGKWALRESLLPKVSKGRVSGVRNDLVRIVLLLEDVTGEPFADRAFDRLNVFALIASSDIASF